MQLNGLLPVCSWRRMCPFCLVLPICSILRKIRWDGWRYHIIPKTVCACSLALQSSAGEGPCSQCCAFNFPVCPSMQQPHGAGQGGAHRPRDRAHEVWQGAADRAAGECAGLLFLWRAGLLRSVVMGSSWARVAKRSGVTTPPRYLCHAAYTLMQVIGDDEEELGGYVTTEEFLRLRDTSTCGKMQVRANRWAGPLYRIVYLLGGAWSAAQSARSTGHGNSWQVLHASPRHSHPVRRCWSACWTPGRRRAATRQAAGCGSAACACPAAAALP